MKRFLLLAAALVATGVVCAQSAYDFQRRSLFDVLPIRSNDIVFLGNSIAANCEWAELFDNRHVKNRGIQGDRAEWLGDRVDTIIAGHPKKLFLLIGINDLTSGRKPREIAADIEKVVDRFQTESRWTKIYVQSILPVNIRAFGRFEDGAVPAGVAATNRLLEAMCTEKGIVYLDIYTPLVDSNGDLNAAYANDGVHLTGEGYLVLRDVLKPYVK